MSDHLRVDLGGALSGHHVLLDPDELTIGLLEDCQSGKFSLVLDGLARVIAGGDLPAGHDRQALRRLKMGEMNALLEAIDSAYTVPKS